MTLSVGGATVQRTYDWNYAGRKLSFSISFDDLLYRSARGLPRVRDDYTAYCMEPTQQPLLKFIVSKFRDFARDNHWNEAQTISMMIAFVQSLPYTSDDVTTRFDEYPRYPVETIFDNGGDCEDTSILLAALLQAMGYDAALLKGPHHMAVGVGIATAPLSNYQMTRVGKYAYLETTGNGFQVGECPPGVQASAFTSVPLAIKPVLEMEVHAGPGQGCALLDITIINQGSAPAPAVVEACFETRNPAGRSQPNRSQTFVLKPGMKVQMQLPCPYPQDSRQVRLLVNTLDARNGTVLKQWQSQWVNQ